jgi:hypothetical protein
MRWQQRRRRRGPCDGNGADCRRERYGRVASQPCGLLQRGRLQAVARTGAARYDLVASVGGGPDGAHGC